MGLKVLDLHSIYSGGRGRLYPRLSDHPLSDLDGHDQVPHDAALQGEDQPVCLYTPCLLPVI